MYRVDYDRAAGLLTLTMRGLLSVSQAEAFAGEVRQLMTGAIARGDDVRILFDAADSMVQQSGVFAAMAQLAEQFPEPPRCAVVVGSALHKLQAKRAIFSDNVRLVESMAEARAWLDACAAAPAPAAAPLRRAGGARV